VLHGTGAAERWLRTHARDRVTMTLTVRDLESGARVPRTATTHVVAGAVGLLRDGRTVVTGARDGHASIGMALRRQPRTLAGVTGDGRLLLATVDGRDPKRSVGVSFPEAAAVLRWLGARDGLSLDGGGSTAMVVQGDVVNSPSDGPERAVGDAVLVVPSPPG
jgi:exopolysaccharide biosynthesis protein